MDRSRFRAGSSLHGSVVGFVYCWSGISTVFPAFGIAGPLGWFGVDGLLEEGVGRYCQYLDRSMYAMYDDDRG
jgi:hypothetical protein